MKILRTAQENNVKVDAQTPPPLPPSGFYLERTVDPFHFDALPADLSPDTAIFTMGGEFKGGPRQEGWMVIDWVENPIGFVPDGEEIPGDPVIYVMRPGPYGRMCAYPEGSEKLKEHEGKDWRSGPTVLPQR